MKKAVLLSICAALLTAQETPSWRAGLSALPITPPTATTSQDVSQFERNMRLAAPYLANSAPNASAAQWEANRAMVRRMAAYLYGLRALSADNSQLRGSFNRAQRTFDSLGLASYLAFAATANPAYGNAGYPDGQPGEAPAPQVNPALPPPYALTAPELDGVSDADKETASDLHARYDADAAHSAGIWQNGEVLRQSLAARGLSLNIQTATSMARLPQLFNAAASALRRNDWEDARQRLMQAEAETEKMAKVVGR